jgi:peptidoglycan/LPS O-acetylase OafA/YrhL
MAQWQNLDLMRGVGALMIVIHHANSEAIPFLAKASGAVGFVIARTKNFGWSGIDLFFVLGGFLMANTFCQHYDRIAAIDLKSYYKARSRRIIPSYYFLLFVLAITGATGWLNFSSYLEALKDILVHSLFLNNYIDQLPNGPTWYLAATVQIYFLMPLFLMGITRVSGTSMDQAIIRVAIPGAILILGLRCWSVFNGTHQPNDFMLTHYRVDTVLMGMLAFCLLKTKHPIVDRIKSHAYLTILVSALFILPCTYFPRSDNYMFTAGFTFLALGYSMLILLLVDCKLSIPVVVSAILIAISTWSYNIYLWHYFVPRIIGWPYAETQMLIISYFKSVSLQAIVQIIMFTVIAVIVGFVMTNLVEKPAAKRLS